MFPTTGTRLSRRPPRYVGANLTANSITVGNSTVNSTSVAIGVIDGGVGALMTNSAITVGNSIANVIANSTTVAVGVVGATSGILLNNNQIIIGNSTVNTAANSTHFFSGNSTVFGFSNSTAEGIANSTGNCITTPLSIYFQSNTTSNSIHSNAALIFNSNATVNSTLNSTALSFGGSSFYISPPQTSMLTTNFALTAGVAAQNVFPSGQRTVTLAASTTFLFDGQYDWLISNATNCNVAISFGNSVAIGTINYAYQFFGNNVANSTYSGQLGGWAVTNGAFTVNTSTLATTNNAGVAFKGYLTTAGAVAITPQFTTTVSNPGNILTGSFIRFVPVGNATINTIGTGWA